MKASRDFREELPRLLKDPQDAALYLNAALEESDPKVFLLALRDVAEVQGGLSRIARLAKLNRENLYRMLSKRGNPEFAGLQRLLDVTGFRFVVQSKRTGRPQTRA